MKTLRNLKLVMSYDGTDFNGWQVQSNGLGIQEVLANAIEKVTGERVLPTGSGRTDSGVHALAQVAHFHTQCPYPVDVLRKALNANLPETITIDGAFDVDLGFCAQRSAKSKLYRYVIHDGARPDVFMRRYAWRVRRRLRDELMHQAGQAIIGTFDFRCFETDWPNRASSVRTIYELRVSRQGDFITISVRADGFLYNMVRAIAGSLYEIGRENWPASRLAEVVASGDRSQAGATAPPQGLFLVRVDYD